MILFPLTFDLGEIRDFLALLLLPFLQKAKANNKPVTLTLAPPAFIIMLTKIPSTASDAMFFV